MKNIKTIKDAFEMWARNNSSAHMSAEEIFSDGFQFAMNMLKQKECKGFFERRQISLNSYTGKENPYE